MSQSEHAYAICRRSEVDCDVMSGRNVQTIEGSIKINYEVASSCSFRDFQKDLFVTVNSVTVAVV